MMTGEGEFGKDVAGKHSLYEPNCASSRRFTKPNSRRKTLNAELTSQCGCGQMLVLRLSF